MMRISLDNWAPIGVDNLEAAAEEAVQEVENNVLITAGPGAGKTEVLAQRACFLLQTGLCPPPKRILAISFKRDAARNLRDRVELRCGRELARRFDSMTFDAFAKTLLDRFRLGLPTNWQPSEDYKIDFTINRQNQMQSILETALGRTGYTHVQIQQFNARTFERDYLTSTPIYSLNNPAALSVWSYLLKGLSPSRVIFTMIGRLAGYILHCNPLLVQAIRSTYAYAFLDEFQDTTQIQYDLASVCFKGSQTIMTAVGDDKQRIMIWAGAVRDAFNLFIQDFTAIPKHLISNYRSIPELVQIQHSISQALSPGIRRSVSRVSSNDSTDVCRALLFADDNAEAEYLSGTISEWVSTNEIPCREICILVRQTPNRYVDKLIDKLRQSGIKARIESDLQDLLAEPITSLLISMLKLIVLKKSPADWSKVTDFLISTSNADEDDNGKIEDSLGVFLNESRQAIENTEAWTIELVKVRLEIVTDFLGNEAIRNVYQQYEQGTYYDDLMNQLASELCNRLAVMNWKDAIFDFEGHDSIPMMTLHKSKGLEFHTVVFIGLEDQALWGYNNNPDEETCGFFVAFSRARKRVVLTASLSRPDRFGRCQNQTIDSIKPLYDLLFQAGVELEEVDA